MKKLFRRHRKKQEDYTQPIVASSSSSPSGPRGTHVCSPVCEGLANLPAEMHDSVIANMSQTMGDTPFRLKVSNFTVKNPRIVSGPVDAKSEVEWRREMEGNTEYARIPLAMTTTYQYPPLPKGHARFLRLGGSGSHPLAYLESHPLAAPPAYIAISYCWDPSSPKRGIFLDLKSFSVSETVLEAMNQVQESQAATVTQHLLWIDQICINQDDETEKLDQIYRMGDIYSKADKVFIWLGPTASESDVALQDLEGMLEEVITINNTVVDRVDLPPNTVTMVNAGHGWRYGHLLARPWFRRLWTVQEALLGRKLVVMCGYREVDFDLLVEFAYHTLVYGAWDLIQPPGVSKEDLDVAIPGVVNLHTLRMSRAAANTTSNEFDMNTFRSLILESRSRSVTMPADRVYALMGIAPKTIRERVEAVQRPSTAQLYLEFARVMLENDAEWLFLSLTPSKDRLSGLPSWVPSLNSQMPYISILAQTGSGFTAGISADTQNRIRKLVTAAELTACGFRLDTVAEIVPQTAFSECNQKPLRDSLCDDETASWEKRCVQLCQKVYGIGPEQFPQLHVFTLMAQSATAPAVNGRAVEAYKVFKDFCTARAETQRMVSSGEFELPERWRSVPDGASKLVEQARREWRDSLSIDDYSILVEFSQTMAAKCAGRPYFSTQHGRLGLGCPGMKAGDLVCILYGITVPYILRPKAQGTMEFVGDAYIHGVMHGEVLQGADRNPDEVFRIL